MMQDEVIKKLKTIRQKQALEYVVNNDGVGFNNMMGLLDPAQQGYIVEAVCLTNDTNAVERMLDPVSARAWCYSNVLKHSDNAPAVFDWWVSQHPNLYRTVSRLLSKALDDGDKEKTLQGLGTTWAQRYVYDQLQNNAGQWLEMTIDWVGATNSTLRQAAVGLGWHAQLFPSMLYNAGITFEQASSLLDKTPYPYSLACLVRYMQEQWEEVDMTTRQVEDMLLEDLGGSGAYSAAADPQDVALAHAIAKSHSWSAFRFEFHPDAEHPSSKLLVEMQHLWDMHVDLNCVSLLMDNLTHGRLEIPAETHAAVEFPTLEQQ